LNKFLITPIRQRLATIGITQNQLDKWLRSWKFFFILGFGRSGTAFLANLLNQAPGAYVFHEPVLEDFNAHLRAHYSFTDAEKYMQGFRKKEIYTRMREMPPGVYGEVNSALRCHALAVKNAFPEAAIIHLVRDGREVVRSHMSRGTITVKNPFSMQVHPAESDPWKPRWDKMDRFARICWYWQEENSRLRMAIGKTIHFEKILSDYEYFSGEVLEPCHIYIDNKTWEAAVHSPQNTTSRFSMPKWDQWTPDQQKTFREICGNEMSECGYTF
jgi:hypothetical protein